MRFVAAITILGVCILCVLSYPAIDMEQLKDADSIYFPDQAEYLTLAEKCPDNMILWLGNRRCYREGEQGPCNFGRVLVFDTKTLTSYCRDEVL